MEQPNPFKKLGEEYKAPKRLKEKVMSSVEISRLLIDVADLFTDKMGRTLLDLFRTKPNNQA